MLTIERILDAVESGGVTRASATHRTEAGQDYELAARKMDRFETRLYLTLILKD
mgnify:FL=1